MENIKSTPSPIVLTILIFLFSNMTFSPAFSQDVTKEKKWNYLIDVYLMFPYMDGELGVGESIKLPVNATAGDVFSKLKMGAMLYFESRTDRWAITSDLVYMKLGQDVTPTTIINSGTLDVKQFIWEVGGLYRLFSFWEVGAGGRLNYLQTSFDAQKKVILPAGYEEIMGSHSKTWYDPIIITRLSIDIKDKWLFQFRGDVGGFGVGSALTWQLQAYAGYSFTRVFQLTAGYRVLSTDYKSGEEHNEFRFNVKEFGPVLRFGFNF